MHDGDMAQTQACGCRGDAPSRRGLLKLLAGFLLAWHGIRPEAARSQDVRGTRPQKNDLLVPAFGDKTGQPIRIDSLELGSNPVLAFPMDPATSLIRDGSRLNQVLLLRLDPADLTEQTRNFSAAGVVAYSAVCTHLGCPPTGWYPKEKILKCWCHDSLYDPKDYGKVVGGPAPRRLALLPIAAKDGLLAVAAEFTGRVGFTPA